MRLEYSAFIMPHIGDSYSQCADRFAIDKNTHRFAVADGVGASFFPEVWAELVVKDFKDHGLFEFEKDTILLREPDLISSWKDEVTNKISNLTSKEKFLVEMSKEKCDFAACTFVGLSIDNKEWHCKALGDSYLFVLDKDYKLITKVASQNGHDFDNFPEYFASEHGKNNGTIASESGNISEVAYFILLTDAISDWFINANDDKRNTLVNLRDRQSFESLINTERASGKMKDDDTTAVIIRVMQDDSENISVEEICNMDITQLIKEEESFIVEQQAERLAKVAGEETTQSQPLQTEESMSNNDAQTTDNIPSIDKETDNAEIKTQIDNNELLELAQTMQEYEEKMGSIIRKINDIPRRYKKELNKIRRKIKGYIKQTIKILDKMKN
ncbi:MAG: hypothetical protein IJT30_04490 [Muribaculaceae bacterium]|nr:hypothetical protein [Muribaculaceae bacterium]